ncbi:MAG: VOC family protein [Actinobacteria bacterium]|nr:VOC family protein [Actinomycetota bacterium]MCA1719752.1 VOC family protein [Actinomycetota bacterium]
MPKIVPNLWFDGQAEEAAAFYTSVFPNSRVLEVAHYPENSPGPAGTVMTVGFELDGQRCVGINGGPQFRFSEAVSFQVDCADQDELDGYWAALSADGEPGPCGWLKDRFGLSWQIVPVGMEDFFNDADADRVQRAMTAMLSMSKLDIAALQRAADGETASA